MKVRCKHCGAFVNRDVAHRVGLSSYCDNEHFMASMTTKPKAKINGNKPKPKSIKRKPAKNPMPPEIAEDVLTRDCNSCRLCGTRYMVHIHHIKYRSEGGPHTRENLIVLCEKHHTEVHGDKKYWQPRLLEMVKDDQ